MSILLDPQNQWLELYHEASGPVLKRKWDEHGRFLGEHPEQALKIWSFRDQVQENFELLAQMLGHQQDPNPGSRMRFSGNERLDGWSFRDVLDERIALEPKVVHLEPSGQGWEPFVRKIKALVLMGGGFGEIITPSPQLPYCCNWDKVPQGHDLLVATYEYLDEIAKSKRADDFPRHLTPGILWHQPDALFQGPCNNSSAATTRDPNSNGCGRVQVLLSSKLLESLPAHRLGLLKSPTAKFSTTVLSPAVIFGRPRRKWVPGDFVHVKPCSISTEQVVDTGAQSRRHLTGQENRDLTTRTRIPLPVFRSLLQADDARSPSSSSSVRSHRTSGTESLDRSVSTSVTSTSLTSKFGNEPVKTASRQATPNAATSQFSSTPRSSDSQAKDYGPLHAAESRLPIRNKARTICGSEVQLSDTPYTESSRPNIAQDRMASRMAPRGAALANIGKPKTLKLRGRDPDDLGTIREAYKKGDV